MKANTTADLSIDKRVEFANLVLDDAIKIQEYKKDIAEKKKHTAEWLVAHDIIVLCEQIKAILNGNYNITDCEIESDIKKE
jgi:hypothetical protein